MKRILFGAALSLGLAAPAFGQTYRDTGGTIPQSVTPLIGCSANSPCLGPVSATNPMPISGTFTASFSGFTPTPSYVEQSVTTSSANYAAPSGTVIIFYNTGANPITVKFGSAGVSVVAGQADVIQPNSWMAFTVPAGGTNFAVVGNGGPSTVVASGGSGLPTGAGGGGGSGGSVPTGSAGSPNAAVVTVQGIGGGTGVPVSGTFWQATQPVSLASLPPLAAGANTIGAISNSSFGISGPLPAFASTPTFNLGTLNGAATAANQTNVQSAPGTSQTTAITVQGNASGVALPVSATSLPLPTGAATAANQTAVTGPVGAGSAPSNSLLQGCIYSSALPSLLSGQSAAVQCDSNARQFVNVGALPALAAGSNTIGAVTQASGPWTMNLTQVAGTALAAPTAWGTAPSGVVLSANVNCLSGCGGSGGASASDNASFTAGSTSFTPMGGEVGAAALTSGHMGVVAMDTGRNLFANVNEWAGSALGAMANYGTSPGAVLVPSVNAFVTNTAAANLAQVNGSATTTAATGTQMVGVEGHTGGVFDATQNSAAPTNVLAIAGRYDSSLPTMTSGNVAAPEMDSSGRLLANVAVLPALPTGGNTIGKVDILGNAGGALDSAPGTSASTAITVQGSASGVAVPVSASSLPLPSGAATAANQANTQGSPTGGSAASESELVGGIFHTSPPTLTNGHQSGLQLDSSGRVIMNCATGCSGSVSPTDESTFTQGTSTYNPIGGFFNSSITPLTSGQAGAAALTASRALTIDALSGSNLATLLGAGTVNTGSPAAGGNIQAAGVYNSSAPTPSSGQAEPLQLDASANLKVVSTPAAANGQDPCAGNLKTNYGFSSSSATFQIVPLTAGKKIYVCSISYRVTAAVSVSLIEGTGTNCGTVVGNALYGSTTAATGVPEAANGGEAQGSGAGSIMQTAAAGDELCILQSGTTLIAGNASVVVQ